MRRRFYHRGGKADAMTRTMRVFLMLGFCCCGSAVAQAEVTVNSYTPAEARAAGDAATRDGYAPGPVLFAQAGDFFFNASKDGHHYGLTVTPDGKVYASTPPG
jgi:hypothetical protein